MTPHVLFGTFLHSHLHTYESWLTRWTRRTRRALKHHTGYTQTISLNAHPNHILSPHSQLRRYSQVDQVLRLVQVVQEVQKLLDR